MSYRVECGPMAWAEMIDGEVIVRLVDDPEQGIVAVYRDDLVFETAEGKGRLQLAELEVGRELGMKMPLEQLVKLLEDCMEPVL